MSSWGQLSGGIFAAATRASQTQSGVLLDHEGVAYWLLARSQDILNRAVSIEAQV